MTGQEDPIKFDGVLGRAEVSAERATLSIYPFAISTEPEEKCVLSLLFDAPAFGQQNVTDLLHDELHVEVHSDRVEGWSEFNDAIMLKAGKVTSEWRAYDAEDHAGHVQKLNDHHDLLYADLRAARDKLTAMHKLVVELLNRAEVKAAASSTLHEKQVAAVSVLNRLLDLIEND